MFKLDLEKAEQPEIKLPTSPGSSKKQESSRKTSTSALLTYAKAFDYVDHNKLWEILQEMGVPDHPICLLRNLYAGQEATVRTGHGTTEWFQIGKGVRQYTALTYSFSYLEPVCCSMSSSNCCFLTCIPVYQEAGQVVWYSHLFQNFPQFIVIHTVKGFGIVNKAEVDFFFGALLFFHLSNRCWQFDLWFLYLF